MRKFLLIATRALCQLVEDVSQVRRFQGVEAFGNHGTQQIADGRDDCEQGNNDVDGGVVCVFAAAS